MQKLLICLERKAGDTPERFLTALSSVLNQYLADFDAVSLAVADEHVAAAKPLEIINTSHPKDAVISVWRDHALGLDIMLEQLKSHCENLQYYAVIESEPLKFARKLGKVNGMCQMAFLRRPENLTVSEWLEIWQGSHTQIAIDTQCTFGYRQNVVFPEQAEAPWPLMHAVVEENFPEAAMTRRDVFFNAEGDEASYKANESKMIESCMRFIDFTAFDCVPMSQYILK